MHLTKLAGAFALAGLCGFAVDLVSGGGGHTGLGLTIWLALAFMTVHMMHVWWWATVRAWRKNGKLTPNVVVVGATRHAERLIKAAMARRDVNVIGVFDDRLSRNPDSVAGVPVLGETPPPAHPPRSGVDRSAPVPARHQGTLPATAALASCRRDQQRCGPCADADGKAGVAATGVVLAALPGRVRRQTVSPPTRVRGCK